MRRVWLFVILLLVSGCASKPPIIVQTPQVVTLPAERPTLPPTWTPIPTLTPLPTHTPEPTQPPTPTLTAADICRDFGPVAVPGNGAQYDFDAKVTFGWRGVPDGVPMALTITLHGQKAGVRIDVKTPGDSLLPIPLTQLPQEGDYDWKLWLQHPQYGEICVYTGTFTRKPLTMM